MVDVVGFLLKLYFRSAYVLLTYTEGGDDAIFHPRWLVGVVMNILADQIKWEDVNITPSTKLTTRKLLETVHIHRHKSEMHIDKGFVTALY